MAFAEVSAHALVAHDASYQVTAAARQACVHRLPRIRTACLAGFPVRCTDGCGGCRGLLLRHRALTRACVLCDGDTRRGLTRTGALRGRGTGRRLTRTGALCGRNRGSTRACAVQGLGAGRRKRRFQGGSCLGFHRPGLHGRRHGICSGGCGVLAGIDRLRGDSHRIWCGPIDAVRGIRARDHDRREDSQAPADSRGGQQRFRRGCRGTCVAWCWPRKCGVGGGQLGRRLGRGE